MSFKPISNNILLIILGKDTMEIWVNDEVAKIEVCLLFTIQVSSPLLKLTIHVGVRSV